MISNPTIYIFLIAIIFLMSCGFEKQEPGIKWNFSKSEITGTAFPNSQNIDVDIYLDATTSMKGFASNENTNFSRLLEDIEGTCQNIWKNTDLQFYKFGRTVESIKREEFVSGKTSPLMYSNPQLSTQTNFAGALRNTNPKRVSILITDLFYNNNDVNAVLTAIKDSCINKGTGVEAGIIGLNSPFNGIVADVQPPVKVVGERPVYVLVFGDKQNISLIFSALRNKPYINQNQLIIFAEKPTEKYEVVVTKNKKNKTINSIQGKLKEEIKKEGTVFYFSMDKEYTESELDMKISLNLHPYVSNFSNKNLKVLAYKKASGSKDSTIANDEIRIENLQYTQNEIKGDIKLKNNDKVGQYSYLIYLTFDNTVALTTPAWVQQVSTEKFAQGINENKTLNFERLITGISTIFLTSRQPKIAKFYINLQKK